MNAMYPSLAVLGVAVTLAAFAPNATAQSVEFPEDLRDFTHVGSTVQLDEQNPGFGFRHFHLNRVGRAAFETGGPYPQGTVFIGKVYGLVRDGERLDEGPLRIVLYMRKDAASQATGGWAYALFGPDRQQIDVDVKAGCFACHDKGARQADYIYSTPLD